MPPRPIFWLLAGLALAMPAPTLAAPTSAPTSQPTSAPASTPSHGPAVTPAPRRAVDREEPPPSARVPIDQEDPPTVAQRASPKPTRPTRQRSPAHKDLKLRRGLWSLGGQVGFGFQRTAAQIDLGAEHSYQPMTGWTVFLQPALGYFVTPAIELVLRPEIVLRFGELYDDQPLEGHQLAINLGARAYLWSAGRWSLYLGLHGGVGARILQGRDNAVSFQGELEPGLLFALGRSVALRLAATLRLSYTPKSTEDTSPFYVAETDVEWLPTLGLAFYL